jgi:hypothetical protein
MKPLTAVWVEQGSRAYQYAHTFHANGHARDAAVWRATADVVLWLASLLDAGDYRIWQRRGRA